MLCGYAVPNLPITIQNIQALRSDTGQEAEQEKKIRTQETQIECKAHPLRLDTQHLMCSSHLR